MSRGRCRPRTGSEVSRSGVSCDGKRSLADLEGENCSAFDLATLLFIVVSSFMPREPLVEGVDVLIGVAVTMEPQGAQDSQKARTLSDDGREERGDGGEVGPGRRAQELLAFDLATLLFIVVSSFMPREPLVEGVDVLIGVAAPSYRLRSLSVRCVMRRETFARGSRRGKL
jgi:hypothetical protein